MEIIDNLNTLLGDDIKVTLTRGSKLRIAASTFSIYAFEALRKELEGVKELQFIFTPPTFVASQATDKVRKERREFFIPQTRRESSLYGSEFEIRLRNKLTQRAIARECADWIQRKVTFKSNKTGAPMQQFGVVDNRVAYMPLQGFTSADLGYERGDAVSNLVNKIDEAPLTAAYLRTFDQIWSSPQQVEDVTQLVHEHIASVYAENSPERIYFLILYNLFSEFLEDISEDVLPDDLTGWRDSEIWKRLYNFQRDAAVGIINKLETYNGCILADSVGLGKTFTALAVIKYYESRNIKPVFTRERASAAYALKKLLDNDVFPYTKDVGILAKWINTVTQGDREAVILDFFAGSGSTGHAVMDLNAADDGQRRYILVQLDEAVDHPDYDTIADVARERLRRAGARVKQDAGLQTSDLDVGFRPLHIATTNLADTLATADDLEQLTLSDAVGSVKPDRTDEDLLFQVLLDWGLDLAEPIAIEDFRSQRVVSVADDALVACFADEITDAVVKEIAGRHPLRAVFLDAGFATDAARINAEQIFREISPETEVRTI